MVHYSETLVPVSVPMFLVATTVFLLRGEDSHSLPGSASTCGLPRFTPVDDTFVEVHLFSEDGVSLGLVWTRNLCTYNPIHLKKSQKFFTLLEN